MELRYQLTRDDLAAYQYAVRTRVTKQVTLQDGKSRDVLYGLAFGLLLVALAAAVALVLPHLTHRRFAAEEMAAGFFLGVIFTFAAIWHNYWRQRGVVASPDGPALSGHVMTLEPQGFRITGPNFNHWLLWPIVHEVSELKTLIVLWMEPAQGIVIPRSAFASAAQAEAFAVTVREYVAKSGAAGALV
jgi:YcxB-like protein